MRFHTNMIFKNINTPEITQVHCEICNDSFTITDARNTESQYLEHYISKEHTANDTIYRENLARKISFTRGGVPDRYSNSYERARYIKAHPYLEPYLDPDF